MTTISKRGNGNLKQRFSQKLIKLLPKANSFVFLFRSNVMRVNFRNKAILEEENPSLPPRKEEQELGGGNLFHIGIEYNKTHGQDNYEISR